MDAYFDWLQNLPFSIWMSESDSLWSYPLILFLHSVGMGMTAGAAFVVGLRLLGVGRPLPVSSIRFMFVVFWAGFFLNLITGSMLFAAAASKDGHLAIYYTKLALIAAGMIVSVPVRRFVDSDASDRVIPSRIKALAGVSLILWVGVITAGRLVAYVSL